jgi:hypothetical protein
MGNPGSPSTKLAATPDKWVQPIGRLADLIVGATNLICGPEDLPDDSSSATLSEIRLGVHAKTSIMPPDNPKITK